MRALVADDHELFRSGLRQLLIDALGAKEVREAETFDQAIDILTSEGAGDLVLVDLRMPGMNGAEALGALRDGFPDAKIAVVSAWEERAEILAALGAGVHGYIPKSLPSTEIAEALRGLARRGLYVEPTAAVAAAGLTRLHATGAIRPEETTVLVLTGSGLKASAAIGELLKLGARPV